MLGPEAGWRYFLPATTSWTKASTWGAISNIALKIWLWVNHCSSFFPQNRLIWPGLSSQHVNSKEWVNHSSLLVFFHDVLFSKDFGQIGCSQLKGLFCPYFLNSINGHKNALSAVFARHTNKKVQFVCCLATFEEYVQTNSIFMFVMILHILYKIFWRFIFISSWSYSHI